MIKLIIALFFIGMIGLNTSSIEVPLIVVGNLVLTCLAGIWITLIKIYDEL